MTSIVLRVRPAVACAIWVVAGTAAAAAEDASRWDGDARSAVRLIAGSRSGPAGLVQAGIEIRLARGWHTYWRYPGDAGVPPRFDFKGSRNVTSISVMWPAPRRLPESGTVSIGYDRDVILPLAIVAQDRAKPVALRLKLDYAICEKLCVPAEGKAELSVSVGASPHHAAVAAAAARVPKKVALGEGGPLAIRSVRREDVGARPRVIVDVAAPPGIDADLFAEGPTPDWALPLPAALARTAAGLQRFAFDLDGAPPGASYKGALLTLTAVAGEEAIEVTTRLD